MHIYLPIAEISVPGEMIFLLGCTVGFLSGVFGVGGGFLTTPFLIFLGVPPTIAVGTQANQLVAAGVSGVMGHWKRSNVDVRLGLVMLGGGIIGSFIGVFIFKFLVYLGQIDFAVSLLYVVLLGSVGSLMLLDSVFKKFKRNTVRREFNTFKQNNFYMMLPYKMRFPKSKLYISIFVPGGIGFIGGILASILGIGGGFLLVPAMIYILGMPILLAAGTSLFQIIFTTAFATVMHATFNNSVDIMLAVMLILGGVIGSQFGVSVGRKMKPQHSRIILAVLILAVSIRLSAHLLFEPVEFFSTVMR